MMEKRDEQRMRLIAATKEGDTGFDDEANTWVRAWAWSRLKVKEGRLQEDGLGRPPGCMARPCPRTQVLGPPHCRGEKPQMKARMGLCWAVFTGADLHNAPSPLPTHNYRPTMSPDDAGRKGCGEEQGQHSRTRQPGR
ncbi:uncharacterized protein A4U43_C09F3230 [Asparagus officinalis]|uniref:Uncharacterized protein n=1 Tax=Asparagus officinalis TaxID=4686 RepID=A0A5P1E4X8_ASPOF|nr:uncharacterized protein A4U43_C09F3230 [Asparagus officinalis]